MALVNQQGNPTPGVSTDRRNTDDVSALNREMRLEKRCRIVITEPRNPCRCLPDPTNRGIPRMNYDDIDCEHYDEPDLDVRRPSVPSEAVSGRRASGTRGSVTETGPIGAPGRRTTLVRAEEERNRTKSKAILVPETDNSKHDALPPTNRVGSPSAGISPGNGRSDSEDGRRASQGGLRDSTRMRFPPGRRVSLLDEDLDADSEDDFLAPISKPKPFPKAQFNGKALDPRTGKLYYYNTETGERKWADPKENRGWKMRMGYTKSVHNRTGMQ